MLYTSRIRAITVRTATVEDAEEIARLHVATSLTAYRPILGEGYRGSSVEERTAFWRDALAAPASLSWTPPELTYLACTDSGSIAGFCAVGVCRDDDLPDRGEVYMLYVSPQYWRDGIGSRLFHAGVAYLQQRSYPELVLWVLKDNSRARSFYEKAGWRPDGQQKASTSRPDLLQVRYRSGLLPEPSQALL